MAGRPKKTAEVTDEIVTKEEAVKVDESAELIKQLMAQIEEQNKKMAEMQAQIAEKNTNKTIDESALRAKGMFKLIHLTHDITCVSTQKDGDGRPYIFTKYGEVQRVRFEDVCDMYSSYPYTFEQGLIYIADTDVVAYLGLSDIYEHLYDKELMDKIIVMRRDEDVELFKGMGKDLQESTVRAIAERINKNEEVDYNNLRRIKLECGIDIEKLAEDLKRK